MWHTRSNEAACQLSPVPGVCIITGSDLKDPKRALAEFAPELRLVPPELAAIEREMTHRPLDILYWLCTIVLAPSWWRVLFQDGTHRDMEVLTPRRLLRAL